MVNLVKFLIVCDWLYLFRLIRKKFFKHKKYAANKKISRKGTESTFKVSDNTTILEEQSSSNDIAGYS